MNPAANTTRPMNITLRGPYVSITQPWIGPSTPLSTRWAAKAREKVVRLQPKSACISATYVPNE